MNPFIELMWGIPSQFFPYIEISTELRREVAMALNFNTMTADNARILLREELKDESN